MEDIDIDQFGAVDEMADATSSLTSGRGADGVVEAVGMETHGSPAAEAAIRGAGLLPDVVTKPLVEHVAVDRLAALLVAVKGVRRGGTV